MVPLYLVLSKAFFICGFSIGRVPFVFSVQLDLDAYQLPDNDYQDDLSVLTRHVAPTLPLPRLLSLSPLSRDYESLPAWIKQEILWRNIAAKPYQSNALPTECHKPPVSDQLFNQSFVIMSFKMSGDEFPMDRPKLTHTYGSSGKVLLQIFPNSSYTGVFKAGALIPGIIRFSLGPCDINNPSFKPSFAMKLLVDGKPSENIFTFNIHGTDGQGDDRNVFSLPFSTFRPASLDPNVTKILTVQHEALKLLPGGDCHRPLDENRLPVYDAAAVSTDTKKVKAPTLLRFLPNAVVGWDSKSKLDYRVNLSKVRPNSLLYTVAARKTEDGRDQIIGKLWLMSQLVASEYQDRKLFFKHSPRSC
ncbi:uncharacterized protein LOC129581327 [Paramacrobiotus metropolitanus]|uniref:uncharacterized protein LOC129581327 n=1 Tax=Paramacrobiotus metropolitanus TaxID=2943436 RepID=UPI0024463C0F|nr:uncharacterized protein LOC129581327 [Paramacrobiotus metropolitanus]